VVVDLKKLEALLEKKYGKGNYEVKEPEGCITSREIVANYQQ